MTEPQKITVATKSAAWERAELVRSRHRWLMQVSSALRRRCEDFLPKEPAEGQASYDVRARRSILWPDFPMAIWSYVGRVLGEEFAVDLGGDEELVNLYNNIDGKGNDLQVFLQQVFIDQWVQGAPLILVESTERQGGKPIWVFFKSNAVDPLVWGKDKNGAIVPKRIHIDNPKRGGLWGFTKIDRTRVVLGSGEPSINPDNGGPGPGAHLNQSMARWEFWRKNDKGDWIPSPEPDEQPGEFPEEEIPGALFQFGRHDEEEPGAIIPPSEWLGELCLYQYAEMSDHAKMIRILRACLLFLSGMSRQVFMAENATAQPPAAPPGPGVQVISLGTYSVIVAESKDAELSTVETTGATSELSFTELKRIRDGVTLAALEPVEPGKAQTLGSKVIDVRLSSATLRASAKMLGDRVNWLMEITAARLGKTQGMAGSVSVPLEFTLTQSDVDQVQSIISLMSEGDGREPLISRETAFEKLKLFVKAIRDLVWKDERAKVEKQVADDDARGVKKVKAFAGDNPLGE